MLNVIKDSYISFFKQFSKWGIFILPLLCFSFLEEYLQKNYGDCFGLKILGIVILTLTELAIFKYAAEIPFGNVWNVVKKTVLISVYQVLIGIVMLIPVYIAMKIGQHHHIMSWGYVFICFVANIFIGGWVFAKANAIVALLAADEKINLARYKEFTKSGYLDWCWVSLLIYFPYVFSLYLVECAWVSIVISSLYLGIFSLFNARYYILKK